MPMYEFCCPSCNKVVEEITKMDAPPPACEECKVDMVKNAFSNSKVGFKFKGSGWYITDYGKGK